LPIMILCKNNNFLYFRFERFIIIIGEKVGARVGVVLRRDVFYSSDGVISHPLAELN